MKPGNVLVTVDGKLKLADFGASFDMAGITHATRQTTIGTPAYMAPEVVIKDKHTTASDIWSFGALVFEMVTGRLPFRSKNSHRLLMELAAGEITIEWPKDMSKYPDNFKEFIEICMQVEPEDRPTAEKLMDHAFFTNTQSSIELTQEFSRRKFFVSDDDASDIESEFRDLLTNAATLPGLQPDKDTSLSAASTRGRSKSAATAPLVGKQLSLVIEEEPCDLEDPSSPSSRKSRKHMKKSVPTLLQLLGSHLYIVIALAVMLLIVILLCWGAFFRATDTTSSSVVVPRQTDATGGVEKASAAPTKPAETTLDPPGPGPGTSDSASAREQSEPTTWCSCFCGWHNCCKKYPIPTAVAAMLLVGSGWLVSNYAYSDNDDYEPTKPPDSQPDTGSYSFGTTAKVFVGVVGGVGVFIKYVIGWNSFLDLSLAFMNRWILPWFGITSLRTTGLIDNVIVNNDPKVLAKLAQLQEAIDNMEAKKKEYEKQILDGTPPSTPKRPGFPGMEDKPSARVKRAQELLPKRNSQHQLNVVNARIAELEKARRKLSLPVFSRDALDSANQALDSIQEEDERSRYQNSFVYSGSPGPARVPASTELPP